MPSELSNETRLRAAAPPSRLDTFLAMKTLRAFLPTISGWITRKGLEYAGFAGLALTAYYKAKEVQLVELLQHQNIPADQIANVIHHTSNMAADGAALIPSAALIGISLFFSRVSAKLEEK